MGDNEPGHTSGEDFIERPVEECILDGGAWQFQCNYENGWCRSLNGRPTGVHQILCSAGEIVCKGYDGGFMIPVHITMGQEMRTHFERLVNWNGKRTAQETTSSILPEQRSEVNRNQYMPRISGFERSRIMKMLDTLFAEVDVLFVSKIEELMGNIELTEEDKERTTPIVSFNYAFMRTIPSSQETSMADQCARESNENYEHKSGPNWWWHWTNWSATWRCRNEDEDPLKVDVVRTRMNAKNLRSREKQGLCAGDASYRSRCPVCVEDRGVDGKHRIEFMTEEDKERTTPIVSLNYDFTTQENADIFPILICRRIRCGQAVTLCYVWKRILENSISFPADFIKVLIFEVSFWKTKTKRARNHFKMWGINYESLRKWFLRTLLM